MADDDIPPLPPMARRNGNITPPLPAQRPASFRPPVRQQGSSQPHVISNADKQVLTLIGHEKIQEKHRELLEIPEYSRFFNALPPEKKHIVGIWCAAAKADRSRAQFSYDRLLQEALPKAQVDLLFALINRSNARPPVKTIPVAPPKNTFAARYAAMSHPKGPADVNTMDAEDLQDVTQYSGVDLQAERDLLEGEEVEEATYTEEESLIHPRELFLRMQTILKGRKPV